MFVSEPMRMRDGLGFSFKDFVAGSFTFNMRRRKLITHKGKITLIYAPKIILQILLVRPYCVAKSSKAMENVVIFQID